MRIDALHIVDGRLGGEFTAASGIHKSALKVNLRSYLIKFSKGSTDKNHRISKNEKNTFDITLGQKKLVNLIIIFTILNKLIKKSSLIHIHGIWAIYSVISILICYRLNKAYMISPHGCLERWSLNHKKLKKTIGLLLLKKFIKKANCFFVTSPDEAESVLREIGYESNIVSHSLGIESSHITRTLESYKNKQILFVSRVSPKKGVDRLIKAFIKMEKNDWMLKIAGPLEFNYSKKLKKIVSNYKYSDTIEFFGRLDRFNIQELYLNSSFFAFPTHSENFGFVIADSLSFKLPVLTTTGAPWIEINEYSCGYQVENNQASFEKYMERMMQLSPEKLMDMGNKGAQLIKERYTWNLATKNVIEKYFSLLINQRKWINFETLNRNAKL
jgi:glycosyltransferase involved in cell wall biosynthesis